jgi:hypothetical protein
LCKVQQPNLSEKEVTMVGKGFDNDFILEDFGPKFHMRLRGVFELENHRSES